jgi:hypothetical protein
VGLVGRDDRGLAEGAGATPRNPLESSNALLLPEGWAVAVRIDDVNRDGWGLPLPLADTVGARLGRVIRLTDRAGELNAVLVLEPKVHSCTGIGLARLLAEVGAGRGDLACVIVRPPHYELVLRRAAELRNASSMGKLLWSCGLEPRLADSADVWIRLGRTIGAAGDRASVRARFVARGQDDLVALLDGSGVAARPHHSGRQWHYTAPLVADTAAYAVVVADTVRAAVGVAPSGHVPAPEEWVTDGGVLWREAKGEVTVSREAGESWHRWARAEHAARRAALAGRPWQIAIGDTGYLVDGLACDDLVTALEAVGDADGDEVGTVVERSDRPYPRGGLAFSQAERAARRNGLVALRADRERGFASDFADGIVDGGPTLLDALDRRGI